MLLVRSGRRRRWAACAVHPFLELAPKALRTSSVTVNVIDHDCGAKKRLTASMTKHWVRPRSSEDVLRGLKRRGDTFLDWL